MTIYDAIGQTVKYVFASWSVAFMSSLTPFFMYNFQMTKTFIKSSLKAICKHFKTQNSYQLWILDFIPTLIYG